MCYQICFQEKTRQLSWDVLNGGQKLHSQELEDQRDDIIIPQPKRWEKDRTNIEDGITEAELHQNDQGSNASECHTSTSHQSEISGRKSEIK